MNIQTVISVVGLLGLGGAIGAWVRYLLEQKRELYLHLRERKEDQYKKFLENLIGFFEGWHNSERKKNFMEELYVHAPLYASSEVIRLANQFLTSFKGNTDLAHKGKSDIYYRKLVVAIREDLGIWEKDKLSIDDVEVLTLDS